MYKLSDDANLHHSKQDYNLWDDSEIEAKCIRVKKHSTKDGYHTWKLFENEECKFILNSPDLTKKMIKFLFTSEGLSFLITQYKSGCNNVYRFKKAVRAHAKTICSK